ncbi:hypothetical protein, partial [uncultured Nostoc sp.]|uniref:hypothetical protein n=1 Tax=uncultured Nostoc sp. TaxID=340711 RepID=UPI0035CBEF1B
NERFIFELSIFNFELEQKARVKLSHLGLNKNSKMQMGHWGLGKSFPMPNTQRPIPTDCRQLAQKPSILERSL